MRDLSWRDVGGEGEMVGGGGEGKRKMKEREAIGSS